MVTDLASRLKHGAQVLGALWRSKQRCVSGWGIHGDADALVLCGCEKPSRFCVGKKQWIMLALCDRDLVFGDYGLALSMTASEWDKTGCVMKVDVEGEVLRVGESGQMKMADLAAIASDPESGGMVLGLLKAFPGSKIQAVSAPKKEKAVAAPVESVESW
jgi:hypothetical protein